MKKSAKVFLILAVVAVVIVLIVVGTRCEHEWKEATCTEPRTCALCGEIEGEARGHYWLEATCTEPKTCSRCGETQGVANGHSWQAATCAAPKTCHVCGETAGQVLPHAWAEAGPDMPRICTACRCMEPLPDPQNGQVFIGQNAYRGSRLTIHNAGNACYIKLKSESYEDVFSFYVAANQTVAVEVPGGKHYVFFAAGDDWYGPEYCFGEDTEYSKDSQLLDFWQYTYEYTLTPVINGNFSETPISGSEF